jgi:hypothetical protein
MQPPDVPPEKISELGRRYRHHYAAQRRPVGIFSGTCSGDGERGVEGLFDSSRTADETAGKARQNAAAVDGRLDITPGVC